jgi:hypothetical protein
MYRAVWARRNEEAGMKIRVRWLRSLTRLATALLVIGLVGGAPATGAARLSRSQEPMRLREAGSEPSEPGRPSAAARRAIRQGYLVPDQAAYERAKKAAEDSTAPSAPRVSYGPAAPILGRSWNGVNDPNSAPSDSTGAIGRTRYIELVNRKFGIYNRDTTAAITTGTLNSLAGADPLDNLFDPQIIWDAGTNRFYYVMDHIVNSTDNRLAFGFSKTSSPSSAADWCKYFLGYGSEFPDYPKLGDTSNFLMIGANVFGPTSFLRTDLVTITKPPSGTSCPNASTFQVGLKQNLRNADGTVAFTPVPANQIDNSSTGWVLATKCCNGGSYLSAFKITRNTDGTPNFGAARTITVPSYALPSNAPQATTLRKLDTLDTRLTQAVSAIDPSRGSSGRLAVWTQHTVQGGAGAEVRWYEINPSAPGLFQSGKRSSSSLFVFNGAVSPDRQVQGTTKRFGANMVLGFNTSSSSTFPDIRSLSKLSGNSQSGDLVVKASTGPLDDFSCNSSNICRWGDYAAATPDPVVASTAPNGQVWLSNQWSSATACCAADWRTRNWAISP